MELTKASGLSKFLSGETSSISIRYVNTCLDLMSTRPRLKVSQDILDLLASVLENDFIRRRRTEDV